MRIPPKIHFLALAMDSGFLAAGLLAGPEATGTALFLVSIGLGAYARFGRPAPAVRRKHPAGPARTGQ